MNTSFNYNEIIDITNYLINYTEIEIKLDKLNKSIHHYYSIIKSFRLNSLRNDKFRKFKLKSCKHYYNFFISLQTYYIKCSIFF